MIRAASIALVLLSGWTLPAAAQLRVEKRADISAPIVLGPNQGAIVVGFRRPDKMSAGKSGTLAFARYDPDKRDVVFQPRDAKKKGDTNTYWVLVRSSDRKLPLDHAVMVVSSGDYVLFGASPGPGAQILNTFCLGSPTFRVEPGKVVYFGDVTPYMMVKLQNGERTMAMAYSSHVEDARAALTSKMPTTPIEPAVLRNKATYACAAQTMLAYEVPGVAAIETLPKPSDMTATMAPVATDAALP